MGKSVIGSCVAAGKESICPVGYSWGDVVTGQTAPWCLAVCQEYARVVAESMQLFKEKSAGGSSVGDCPARVWSPGFSLRAWSLPKYSFLGQTACGKTICQSRTEVQGAGHESEAASPIS